MGFEFLRVDRTGTGSEKWAVVPEHIRKSGSIPLSLADMEVATAPAIIEAMEKAINLGTVMGAEQGKHITIHAPFENMTKADEIRLGLEYGADLSLTWSCYRGGDEPCGTCDSCLLRARAFAEVGIPDPALKAKN